jgi:hypothetical protein
MPKSIAGGAHVVTDEEWKLCEALGYFIYAHGITMSLTEFIELNFRGLELLKFLKEIDDLLRPMTGKSITRVISYNDTEPFEFVIQYYSEDNNDDTYGLAFSRTFTNDKSNKIAVHDFFRIPHSFRRLGHGKTMINYCLQQYLNIGVDKIKVHAALADGGFVWARAHFTATEKKEVSLILALAKLTLGADDYARVKEIYNNYYTTEPDGKSFPINKWSLITSMKEVLQKSNWHGEIDLNNQELLTKFKNYVTGQK